MGHAPTRATSIWAPPISRHSALGANSGSTPALQPRLNFYQTRPAGVRLVNGPYGGGAGATHRDPQSSHAGLGNRSRYLSAPSELTTTAWRDAGHEYKPPSLRYPAISVALSILRAELLGGPFAGFGGPR